jgi:hypothetical protein
MPEELRKLGDEEFAARAMVCARHITPPVSKEYILEALRRLEEAIAEIRRLQKARKEAFAAGVAHALTECIGQASCCVCGKKQPDMPRVCWPNGAVSCKDCEVTEMEKGDPS